MKIDALFVPPLLTLAIAGVGPMSVCVQGCGGAAAHKRWDPKKDTRDTETLQRRCDEDDDTACLVLAYRLGGGNRTPRDYQIMEHYERKACDLNNMLGCENLARTYEIGVPGVEQNIEKARVLYKRACDGEQGYACLELAMLYHWGDGVPPNPKAAELYFGKACRASKQICKTLEKGLPERAIDVDRVRETIRDDETVNRCLIRQETPREGWMAFSFLVDTHGKATELKVLGTTAPSLADCISDRLRSLAYHKSAGSPSGVLYLITMDSDGSLTHEKPAAIQSLRRVLDRAEYAPFPSSQELEALGKRPSRYRATSMIYFCVDPSGQVAEAQEVQGPPPPDPQLTRVILETIRSWRFIPILVDGTAVKTCAVYTFEIEFN